MKEKIPIVFPIRVFIGYDKDETVAYYTLLHSINRHATAPIQVTPVMRTQLETTYYRMRGDKESTDFSISRFMVPWMCDYKGFAIFMDCDMLFRTDIAKLMAKADYRYAVQCVQHEHHPTEQTKMLGQEQTDYKYKNWSSLMIFNCSKCHALTPKYVNDAPGLDLHQFKWLEDPEHEIGALEKGWNYLVGYDTPLPKDEVYNVHFTSGGPWWEQYTHVEYADEWIRERYLMNHAEQRSKTVSER